MEGRRECRSSRQSEPVHAGDEITRRQPVEASSAAGPPRDETRVALGPVTRTRRASRSSLLQAARGPLFVAEVAVPVGHSDTRRSRWWMGGREPSSDAHHPIERRRLDRKARSRDASVVVAAREDSVLTVRREPVPRLEPVEPDGGVPGGPLGLFADGPSSVHDQRGHGSALKRMFRRALSVWPSRAVPLRCQRVLAAAVSNPA